jgi:glycosyltransferase involved in cell wall biosynthesis
MEAQACGVIPVASPKWALRENIRHGILIEGDITDTLVQHRFSGELIRLLQRKELQDKLRKDMMEEAKHLFNWERFVDQWIEWANEGDEHVCQH